VSEFNADINLDVNASRALAKINKVDKALNKLGKAAQVSVKVNGLQAAEKAAARLYAQLEKIENAALSKLPRQVQILIAYLKAANRTVGELAGRLAVAATLTGDIAGVNFAPLIKQLKNVSSLLFEVEKVQVKFINSLKFSNKLTGFNPKGLLDGLDLVKVRIIEIGRLLRSTFGGAGGTGGQLLLPGAGGTGGGAGGGGGGGGALAIPSQPFKGFSTNTIRDLQEASKYFKNLVETAEIGSQEFRAFGRALDMVNKELKEATRSVSQDDLDRRFEVRRRRARVDRLREKKRRNQDALSSGLIGGAFPLLFGQGAGASIGGALGGAGGGFVGGNLGFGLSLVGTALGTAFDDLTAASIETGQALKDPIGNFDQLNDKLQLFNKEGALGVKNLIALGRSQEAANEIQRRLIDVVGTQGYDDLVQLGDATKELSKDWAELTVKMQALMAGPLGALLRALNKGINGTAAGTTNRLDGSQIFSRLSDTEGQKFLNEINKASLQDAKPPVGGFFPGTGTENVDKVLEKYAKLFPAPAADPIELTPAQKQADADAELVTAEKKEALRKQGIALERSVAQFRLSNEDTIYGFKQKIAGIERQNIQLRQSIENRIFNQRQAIAKQESDNIRKQQQIDIDRQDLALSGSRTFTNAPGEDLANSLSDAVRGYIKTRAEGEANLQQKEREFTIATLQLEKRQADFELQVQQKVEVIKRNITEYERSVTKYKLDTATQIYNLQISAADYVLAKAKERVRTETEAAAKLKGTADLAEMVRSGNYGAGGKYMQGSIGPTSTGPHFDIKRKDGSFFGRTALDEYVKVNGKPLSSGVTVPGGEFGASRSYGSHKGWDYAFGGNAGLTMSGGAKFMDTQKTAHGDATAFMTPDGQVYQILHGTFVPPTKAETATASSMPAMPAALAAPAAPGVTDVSGLNAQSAKLNQDFLATKQNALETQRIANELNNEQAAAQITNNISNAIKAINAPLDTLLQNQKARFEDEKAYARLLQEGISPALAQQTVEIERQVSTQLQQLDTLVARTESQIILLQGLGKETTELEKQLQVLKDQKDILEGKGQSAVSAAATNEDGKKIRDYMTQLQGELNDTDAMIVSLSKTVTSELGTAMSDAITGLIDGTTSVEEAFSDMFANIGKAFIDMATQMLAQKAILMLLSAFTKGPGGGAVAGAEGIGAAAAGGFSFAGGGYTGDGPRSGGVDGQGGFPAILHPQETVIDNYGGRGAMNYYGGGSGGVNGGGDGTFRLETTVINGVEYATVEQVRAMGQSSARQGAAAGNAMTMNGLRNSRSQRAKIGMGR